jgi:predicted transposase/invertase (TIGR01784 family)
MPFRMADYRLRLHRRFPHKRVRQIVIYLNPTGSDLVYQTSFEISGMRHEFEVIRLWEQPTEPFLEATGLLPLAVLSKTSDKAQTLRQVAAKVDAIPDRRVQSNVAASAGILAGLQLDKGFINQVLRREIMQQSVIYQEILQEGEQKGRQEGRQEGELTFALRLITHRFGTIAPNTEAQIRSLSLTQIEELGEALLDFSQPSDLNDWLRTLGA